MFLYVSTSYISSFRDWMQLYIAAFVFIFVTEPPKQKGLKYIIEVASRTSLVMSGCSDTNLLPQVNSNESNSKTSYFENCQTRARLTFVRLTNNQQNRTSYFENCQTRARLTFVRLTNNQQNRTRQSNRQRYAHVILMLALRHHKHYRCGRWRLNSARRRTTFPG